MLSCKGVNRCPMTGYSRKIMKKNSSTANQRMNVHTSLTGLHYLFSWWFKKPPQIIRNPTHAVMALGLYAVRIWNNHLGIMVKRSSATHRRNCCLCSIGKELIFQILDGFRESSVVKKRPLLSTFTSQHVTIVTLTVTCNCEWQTRIGDLNAILRDKLFSSEKVSTTFISPGP